MKRRLLIGCFAGFGVLLLILDAATAINAAQTAVELCIRVIIPSLFPFFVVIDLLSSSLNGLHMKWLTPLEKWMQLPNGGGALFLCGLLGGYPTGAQMIQKAWKDGGIDRSNAERMLAFCSNAGPAFIFGIIGPMLGGVWGSWLLWGIHIASAILVGCVIPFNTPQRSLLPKSASISVNNTLRRAVTAMCYVCGWVVLFRVIIGFCSRWFLWLLPTQLQVALISVLELANGCTSLGLLDNMGVRMLIASASVNFGGICVLMQTATVAGGLRIRNYLKGKLIQTLFAVIFTMIAQYFLYPAGSRINLSLPVMAVIVIILTAAICFSRKRKITVDFQGKMLYNIRKSK